MKKRGKGRQLLFRLAVMGLCLCLFGCQTKGKTEADMRSVLSSAMTVFLSVERRGEVYTANVTLGEGDTDLRDAEIRFLTPPSVEGLTVFRKKGETGAEFGSLSVKDTAVKRILQLLSPFSLGRFPTCNTSYREGEDTVFCFVGERESITFYMGNDQLPHKILYTVEGEALTLYPTLKEAK